MSPLEVSWDCKRDLRELQNIREKLNGFLNEVEFPPERIAKLILCVDEAAANVIKYCATCPPPNPPCDFRVQLKYDGTEFTISFIDQGIPYDPTSYPEVDLASHIRSGKRGGLGLHIMRKNLDIIRYEYSEGANRFTLGVILPES